MRSPASAWSFAEIHPGDPRIGSQIAPLLRSLRPDLTDDSAKAFLQVARSEGYILSVCADAANVCCALAGHRILTTSRGKILFVEDLAVTADQRGEGIGAKFVEHLTQVAELAGCDRLELDTGITNQAAQRFYERNSMECTALHYSKSI